MYHKRKHWLAVIGKRGIAVLLTLSMLISFAPTVIAEGIELTDEVITDIIPTVTETAATEEVTALSEITEMRDEFSKTFLMSDGTYTQVSYASPVHYEDENGVFQEIDNRLSVNAMTGKVTTGNGGTDVAFSQSQPQVSIDANGHNISWNVEKKTDLRNDDNVSLMNISPSYAPFTANAVNVADTQDFKALPEEEKLMSAHKAFSEMKYTSLEEGYAVNYTVSPGKVKEDILITSAENNEFVITVNAMGLTASLGDYRTVIFRNNANETVLTFDVPYMYDANDEFSTDIDIALTPIIGGYEITLTADEEWLESEDRVYPVVIDPWYIYGDHVNESNIVDTMVHTGDSSTNCSCGLNHDTNNFVIINKYNSKQYYSYFKFMSSDAYAAGGIESASLNLHLTSTTYGDATFRLYRVAQDWDQSTITYSNRPNVDSTPIDSGVSYTATGSGSNRVVTAEFDISQWLRDNNAGLKQNYGFMLAYDNESINDYNRFHTVDYETVAHRPQVKVNYRTYWPGSGETHYINNIGSHLFMSANASTLETATYHHSTQGSISNAGLNWVITPLDNYVSYFAISWGEYHLYDTGTQVRLYYATPPEDINLSTVRTEFQWQIFEYSNEVRGENYCVIKNRYTGRFLSVSGNDITAAIVNSGNYQRWLVGYTPCTSIEIENREAVAGEVIEFEDLGIDYNGTGADPTFADDYSFCNVTVSPSVAAVVTDGNIVISSNFIGVEITVTFGRADTSATAVFKIYVYRDRYTEELIKTFGFEPEAAALIRSVYDRVDASFSSESTEMRAWRSARILSLFDYNGLAFNEVAGGIFLANECQGYFENVLGFSTGEYYVLYDAITLQHSNSQTPDFSHMQYSLSARLAYFLNLEGFVASIGSFCVDEDISYFAGWLGDAVLCYNGTTSMGNDDYCADLDAENVYNCIIGDQKTAINAFNSYYQSLTDNYTRADVFLENIPYATIKSKIYYELIDKELVYLISLANEQGDIYAARIYAEQLSSEEYHLTQLDVHYPDTYDFLSSLQDSLSEMGSYDYS